MRRAGVSLTETIVAILILVTGIFATVTLLHASLRRSRAAVQRAHAALVAASAMDRVKHWAGNPANFSSGWDPYSNDSYTFDGGYTATIESNPAGLAIYSPSSSLEANFPGRERRLTRSLVPVKVTVSWDASDPVTEVRMLSYVGEPPLTVASTARVQANGPTGPIAAGATAAYTAQLADASGNQISDLVFSWSLIPVSGNATLQKSAVDRVGQSMRLYHDYVLPNGASATVSGDVDISAVVRYLGREYRNGDELQPDLRVNLD